MKIKVHSMSADILQAAYDKIFVSAVGPACGDFVDKVYHNATDEDRWYAVMDGKTTRAVVCLCHITRKNGEGRFELVGCEDIDGPTRSQIVQHVKSALDDIYPCCEWREVISEVNLISK